MSEAQPQDLHLSVVPSKTDASLFEGRTILAPLTMGGNLPFRRLCTEFGAAVTVSEMTVVKRLLDGRRSEFALLRSHPDEVCFGVQLADRNAGSLAEGARIAASRGARFIDLNCGCPIEEMTRRGLGASLLRKPSKIARLIEAMRLAVDVPITVKLRAGWAEGHENVSEVARACEEAGASAITVHGRTREQRYSRAADWELVGKVAAERGIPVVGNGDILTDYEARERWRRSGCSSIMVGRGALIRPWLFREIAAQREWLPSTAERVGVAWRLAQLMREHFGLEPKGVVRAQRFLAWHLGFFCRYRPFPAAAFEETARVYPLLQTRSSDDSPVEPLEALLRDARPEVHERLAEVLLASTGAEEAVERSRALLPTLPPPEEARAVADDTLVAG